MDVTVAICTWNRAALLDQTLARMAGLRIPPGLGWELVVVNNNSTDDTDAVIARHAPYLPLRRLFEPNPGLSNARNRAVTEARGELLVWTDDDVQVDPDWLAEYAKAAARFPHAGYFGGSVDPWFAVPPPRWVRRHLQVLEGPFAVRRLGPAVRLLAPGEKVFGANMAFRTRLLADARFDPALGRIGAGMLSGEETDLVDRLHRAGHGGVWVGSARVRHYVPAARLTTRYVWDFFHGLGRTKQRQAAHDRGVPRLFGAPRWVVREYLAARAVSLVLAPWGGAGWVHSFTRAAVCRGVIDECRAARPAGGGAA